MRKNLRRGENPIFNSILSALLRFILNLIFVILSFVFPQWPCLDSDFVYYIKEQNRTTKSGCKSLMAVCFDFVFAVLGCESDLTG